VFDEASALKPENLFYSPWNDPGHFPREEEKENERKE
jgi:hypothetical protein